MAVNFCYELPKIIIIIKLIYTILEVVKVFTAKTVA